MSLTRSLVDDGPPPPCPERFNMAAHVLAAGPPGTVALGVLGDGGEVAESWTYADLARAILGTAAGLRAAGLEPGDRVALRIGNRSEFPVLFFGAVAAGGVAVPTSAELTAPEFARLAEDMAPRFLACEASRTVPCPPGAILLAEGDWPALAAHAPMDPAGTAAEDPAFLVYTSGTGGRPKGVLHAHRAAWARQMMWDGWYGLGPADVVLHAGAFNWTYTLGAGLTDPWAAGARTLIYTGPKDAGIWPGLIREHGATIFAAVPGVYRQMLREAGDLHGGLGRLRHGLTAGEACPEALFAAWEETTGLPLYEALGMSEISTYVSSSPRTPRRPGRSGRPQRGRRVAVIDGAGRPVPVGEAGDLAVSRRDPGLMLGYWRREEETRAAFRGEWFVTGDRAEMDADGYIAHLGRADDVMTSLGYRVSPAEVEEALAAMPEVAEVAVAELPVRADLSLIAAFVVAEGDWPGEARLAGWVSERLAPYKRPRLWIEVKALPRTTNGKLRRRDLVAAHRRDGHSPPPETGPDGRP